MSMQISIFRILREMDELEDIEETSEEIFKLIAD